MPVNFSNIMPAYCSLYSLTRLCTTCQCTIVFFLILSVLPVWSSTAHTMSSKKQHKTKSIVLDVKPGAGRQVVEERWGEFSCVFEYKSQGGTNEQWSLTMARNKKGTEWLCTVERPSGLSYLFFEEFKLRVAGADLQEFLLESKPGVSLRLEEYIMEENYVQQSDKFNSQLTKVQIFATSKKRLSTEEL